MTRILKVPTERGSSYCSCGYEDCLAECSGVAQMTKYKHYLNEARKVSKSYPGKIVRLYRLSPYLYMIRFDNEVRHVVDGVNVVLTASFLDGLEYDENL